MQLPKTEPCQQVFAGFEPDNQGEMPFYSSDVDTFCSNLDCDSHQIEISQNFDSNTLENESSIDVSPDLAQMVLTDTQYEDQIPADQEIPDQTSLKNKKFRKANRFSLKNRNHSQVIKMDF
jgi:predicted lipase